MQNVSSSFRRRNTRRAAVAAAVTVSALLVFCGISPATADDYQGEIEASSDDFALPDEVTTQNQMKLGELTSWILDQPGVEESGYIAQINDAASLSVELLWKGNDPLQEAAIARAKELGISVTVQQRPHSLPEIDKIANDLLDARDQFAARGFEIDSVAGVGIDSGEIVVSGDTAATNLRSASAQAVATSAADLAAEIAGVPVRIETGVETQPTGGTRQNATLPLWAGALMFSLKSSAEQSVCSSGFAVTYGGSPRATTARHCIPPTGTWRAANNLTPTNFGSNLVTSTDGALTVLTGAGGPRTFDNEWNNSSGFSKNVYNAYDVGLNDSVCTSGGNSGVHCNVKITNMRVWADDGYGSVSMIQGEQQTAGKMALAKGDSGGPVFMPYGGSFAQSVGAVGMMQIGRSATFEPTPTDCGNQSVASECYRTVLFTSINTVVKHGGLPGLSLLTGPN